MSDYPDSIVSQTLIEFISIEKRDAEPEAAEPESAHELQKRDDDASTDSAAGGGTSFYGLTWLFRRCRYPSDS